MNSKNHGKASPVLVTGFNLASVAHRSWLIIDVASRTAAVIDPQPRVEPYLEAAARENARIRHVFLTKLHTDFECGHRELQERTGAVVYTGAWARPDYDHLPVKDGDALHFGATSLKVLETPGHTLEGISIVAGDVSGTGSPWGLFCGDLLFPGDIARPEPRLSDGYQAAQLAEMLHHSLHRKILALPPGIRVYSGHAAPGGTSEPETLGTLRAASALLQPLSRGAFVRLATEGMLPSPQTREFRNALNRTRVPDHRTLQSGTLPRLALDAFLAKAAQGCIVIDLREPREFAAAHLQHSLNLGLGADFAVWAPALLDATETYILIANPGSEAEATARLTPLIGGRIRGILSGGMIALESRPELLEDSVHSFAGRGSPESAHVDVRAAEDREESAGRARRLPLEELLGRLHEVPARRSVLAVLDLDPYRAHAAASLLRRRGWPEALPVVGPRHAARVPAARR